MPTYEYACTDCGTSLDVVHGFNDRGPRKCKECGGSLRKVYHPVGIVLKGSGFYKTDSRSGNGSGSSKKSSGDESAASSSSESKSDSKSESKSESKPESKSDSKDKKASKVDSKSTASSKS